jgi:hypothetical protein
MVPTRVRYLTGSVYVDKTTCVSSRLARVTAISELTLGWNIANQQGWQYIFTGALPAASRASGNSARTTICPGRGGLVHVHDHVEGHVCDVYDTSSMAYGMGGGLSVRALFVMIHPRVRLPDSISNVGSLSCVVKNSPIRQQVCAQPLSAAAKRFSSR